jgi:UDP-N-acetyl-D-mannosaminuronate dehydrogenase
VISDKEEREVKARIMGVLFQDDIPDPRDSMLIGLCRAGGLFSLILSTQELDRVQPRIDQVADLEELNRSLADAIREIYAQIARYAPMV